MKAYLLLDNGFKIEGNLFGQAGNILGELSLTDEGTYSLNCLSSDSACVLTQSSASLKEGNSAFFSADIKSVQALLNDVVPTYAKLVVDGLGEEYHLYDLKTFIPGVELKKAEKKATQKEAA